MILLGIAGAIGHGKSTLADYLIAQTPSARHFESSDIIIEVADALRSSDNIPLPGDWADIERWLSSLPAILASIAHEEVAFAELALTQDHYQSTPADFAKLTEYLELLRDRPTLQTGAITRDNKDQHRAVLQWLGAYLRLTVDPWIWFREVVRRAKQTDCTLATAGGVRFQEDAVCLRHSGGKIIQIIRPAVSERDATDATERERSSIIADATIYNDGSLAQLAAVASELWQDAQAGQLQPTYRASDTILS